MESAAYQPPVSDPLSTNLQLFISCTNLRDVDFIGKSDPYVIAYMKENDVWKEIGRTETVTNNLNPKFHTSFIITYYFEKH